MVPSRRARVRWHESLSGLPREIAETSAQSRRLACTVLNSSKTNADGVSSQRCKEGLRSSNQKGGFESGLLKMGIEGGVL